MPLAPTFWAKTFGMLTDRYGVSWAVNGEPIPLRVSSRMNRRHAHPTPTATSSSRATSPRRPTSCTAAGPSPSCMKQWFAPKPWTTPHAETRRARRRVQPDRDARPRRPGVAEPAASTSRWCRTGASSPPTPTSRAWEPSAKPFMTWILTFDDLGGGRTRYTARARHWSEADREAHEKMGFHEGWGSCTDQLAELAAAAVKYLCLVYLDAEHWNACTDAECADYAQQLAERPPPARGRAAAPRAHRHHGAGAQRRGHAVRRPVRRDQGDARRLLPGRRRGPERGDPDRRRHPAGAHGSIEVRPVRELQAAAGA